MKISFGIITDGSQDKRIQKIIKSIEDLSIPEYEIIVVGNSKLMFSRGYVIPFDETKKYAWITRKKNIITNEARYENIVYIHDYIEFLQGWYEGVKSFKSDWDVMMTCVDNLDGTRFRDWLICDDPQYCDPYLWDAKIAPYDYKKTEWMYVSGAYWIAKRDFMKQHPLDERFTWGQGEDVEWSKRVRHKWKYVLNTNARVRLLKQQELALKYVEKPTKGKFTDYFGTDSRFINCSGVIPYNRGAVSG